MIPRVFAAAMVFALAGGPVLAEDGAPAAAPAPVPTVETLPPVAPAPVSTAKSPLIQKRGKRREQKETEGSEAPERFEADTILKSQYTLDGHPLEVDPD